MNVCQSCGSEFKPPHPDQNLCDACHALVHPPAAEPPLQKIGSYSLAHELGVGRFATTWLAEASTGGGVILKLLRAYAPDTETARRFLDEARVASANVKLDQPSLSRVLDAGVHLGGALFLVYESGGEQTLADELRVRGRLVALRALELCAQVAEGLHQLHVAGYHHFDLKPANVGVTRDERGREQAVLLDAMTGHLLVHAGLRETGMLPISTVAYLAPELAAGTSADARADLYAVAVICYQLLSGRLPFTGHSVEELIESHLQQKPLRLRDVGRRVHPELESLLQKALAKDPNQRFHDGLELARELRKVAPIADQPADDPSEDDIEDPLQVMVGAPPEPEVAPPPKQAPVFQRPPPARRPSIPPPRPRALLAAPKSSWLTPMRILGIAIVAIAIIFAGLYFRPSRTARARKKKAPAPIADTSATVAAASAPAPAIPAAAPASPPDAASAPIAQAAPPTPAPEPDASPAPGASAPSKGHPPKPAAAKKIAAAPPGSARAMLAEAQKQMARKEAKPAMRTLFTVLARSDLSASDQAQTTRMMAEAETIAGNKPAAIDWYRKYLRLTDSSAERTRVVRLIQTLNH